MGVLGEAMRRFLLLFPFYGCLFCSASLEAQWCNYPVSLLTSKDYCIGSTLKVSSTHPLESIVWYRNGQPVDSAKASESLSHNGVVVAHESGTVSQIELYGIA